MSKKTIYTLLIISSIIFIYLFIMQIIDVMNIFKNPTDFNLYPVVWIAVIAMVLLGHVGLFVAFMDKEVRNNLVFDDDEWWLKWDQA